MAKEMKLRQMGTVCPDGAKIHANALRHSALSHGPVSYTHLDVYKRQLDERAPIDPEPGSLSGKRRSRKDVQPLARAAKVRSTGAKLALVPTTAKGDDKGRKSRRRS